MIEESLPSWGRGLKYNLNFQNKHSWRVAPFMGAWIEMSHIRDKLTEISVAPFMGAWIEMEYSLL